MVRKNSKAYRILCLAWVLFYMVPPNSSTAVFRVSRVCAVCHGCSALKLLF